MNMGYLALTALWAVAPSADPIMLTPDNLAEHGFHLQCYVVDDPDKIERVQEDPPLRPRGPVLVRLRFGLLSKGRYAILAKDLEAIRGVCLVVRDGDAVQMSMPLSVKVDPGNVVHLYTHFSTQEDLLSKTQLVFDEGGEDGPRTFLVNLKDFIQQR